MKRMGTIKNIIVLYGLMGGMLTSCVNYQFIQGEMRIVPKDPAYQLKGKLLPGAADGIVDPFSIYLYESQISRNISYHYYRFWDDGHVSHRSIGIDHLPTREEAESFWGCDVGFYTLDNQQLLIELFVPDSSAGGRYLMVEAEVVDGDIVEKKSWLRGLYRADIRVYSPPRIYQKVYIGKMETQPDW